MKLAQLKAFLAVVDFGSYSEAALELNMSQAAVSYAVAELERELGAKVLERGRFGARPNGLGKTVAEQARAMTQLEATMLETASLSQGRIEGDLRITAFRSAAGRIVSTLMSKLRKAYPELKLHLTEIDNEGEGGLYKAQLVRQRQADIAFIDGADPYADDLLTWELLRDPFYALLPTSDPREVLSWLELKDNSLILSTGPTCGGHILRHLEHIENPVTPAYTVQEDSTVTRMVGAELGLGILPAFAIDALPEGVKKVPMDTRLERSIYITLLPESLKRPSVRVFLNALKDAYPESELPRLELTQALAS